MFAEPAASKNWPGLTLRPCAVWSLLIASTLLIIIYRVWSVQFPWLSNSSPLMALCFGGGLLLGRRFWWVPVLLVLSSDFCVGLINGGYGIGSYTAMSAALFCGAAWAGSRLGAWSGRNGLTAPRLTSFRRRISTNMSETSTNLRSSRSTMFARISC